MLLNSVNILLMSGCLAHGGGDDQVILAKVGLLVWGLDECGYILCLTPGCF